MPAPMSSMGLRYPEVLGYKLTEQIGGGGFSRVFHAINVSQQLEAAIKVISLPSFQAKSSKPAVDKRTLLKEAQIHGSLKHLNVLEFVGYEEHDETKSAARRTVPGFYIVLEFAAGGDLFDKIAPDFGVSEDLAHFYFTQLIAGLSFVHGQGICHRDLKPENLLLDRDGNLKIADFGLCSVFRYKGQERALSGACGSLPYIAPEMNGKPYRAEPVDVWSSGVVLFAMLVGNTPWDEPTKRSPEFREFLTGRILRQDPWTRIPRDALSLLTKTLQVKPEERIRISDIEKHRWFRRENPLLAPDGRCSDPVSLAGKLMEGLVVSGDLQTSRAKIPDTISYSQPENMARQTLLLGDVSNNSFAPASSAAPALSDRKGVPALSQPFLDESSGYGHSQFTQAVNLFSQWSSNLAPSSRHRLNPHLTRFFSPHQPLVLLPALVDALTNLAVQNAVEPLGDDLPVADDQEYVHEGDDTMDLDGNGHEGTIKRSGSDASLSGSVGSVGSRIRVGTVDSRKCTLKGEIRIERLRHSDLRAPSSVGAGADGGGQGGSLVLWRRSKGSPLEWRRLFRAVIKSGGVRELLEAA